MKFPRQATHALLDYLLLSSKQGKWRAFVDALIDAEYPYLAKLLDMKESPRPEYLHPKRTMELFSPYLQEQLNPLDLVPPLFVAKVINLIDKDEVMMAYNRLGATAASMCLLDLIQRRLDPDQWYTQFLKILCDTGRHDLAKLLEPEFSPDTILKCSPVPIVTKEEKSVGEIYSTDELTERLKHFSTEIEKYLKVPKIINFLVPVVISPDERSELLEIDNENARRAVSKLLTIILERKFIDEFILALQAADYPYLADILLMNDVYMSYSQQLSDKISIFRPSICSQLDPYSVLPYLYSSGIINHLDKEEILSVKKNSGGFNSVNHLLECIQCRQRPKVWYREFLNSLSQCGQTCLAKLIEPDYTVDSDIWISKFNDSFHDNDVLDAQERELSDNNDDTLKLLYTQLDELTEHENSVLRSVVDTQSAIDSLRKDVKKEENNLLEDLQKQVSSIMDKICKSKCSLKTQIEVIQRGEPRYLNVDDEHGHSGISKLTTVDKKLAAIKFKPIFETTSRPLLGTVSNNVIFNPNAIGQEFSEALPAKPEISAHNPFNDAATAKNQPSNPEKNTDTRVKILSNKEKVDENDKLSDTSSNPSSSYLIFSGTFLEELETEEPLENNISSMDCNGSYTVTEHQDYCVLSDIKILPNGHCVIADSRHRSLLVFNEEFHFQKEIKLDGQPLHFGPLSLSDVAVQVYNVADIILCSLESTHQKTLKWPCESILCTLCTKEQRNIYTLCEGKHMHLFKLDSKICDDYDLGVENESWWPKFMALDDEATTKNIFLTERNSNSIYCFALKGKSLNLRRQYSVGTFLSLSGIVYCSGRVLIADSDNDLLIELDKKGNYKTSHSDNAMMRPYAIAYFDKQIFLTHANTGRRAINNKILCYKLY